MSETNIATNHGDENARYVMCAEKTYDWSVTLWPLLARMLVI